MFSAAQHLISDTGQPVGRWQPHIMIYYPYMPAIPVNGTPSFHAGVVSGAGTAQSSIIIAVHDFVPVRPEKPSR
jgi:hypothetical protein